MLNASPFPGLAGNVADELEAANFIDRRQRLGSRHGQGQRRPLRGTASPRRRGPSPAGSTPSPRSSRSTAEAEAAANGAPIVVVVGEDLADNGGSLEEEPQARARRSGRARAGLAPRRAAPRRPGRPRRSRRSRSRGRFAPATTSSTRWSSPRGSSRGRSRRSRFTLAEADGSVDVLIIDGDEAADDEQVRALAIDADLPAGPQSFTGTGTPTTARQPRRASTRSAWSSASRSRHPAAGPDRGHRGRLMDGAPLDRHAVACALGAAASLVGPPLGRASAKRAPRRGAAARPVLVLGDNWIGAAGRRSPRQPGADRRRPRR